MTSFARAAWRSTGLAVCLTAGLSMGCAALAKSNETAAEAAKGTAKPAAKGSAKDTAKETPKGTGKDAAKDAAKGASKGPASAHAKDAAKKDAAKKPADKPKPAAAVPAPKSQPTASGSSSKPAPAPAVTATVKPTAPAAARPVAAPVLAPATRQHAAPRKPVIPAAVAATSSTPQADKDTLETVIELVRKRKAGEATAGDIGRLIAAEYHGLRSDDSHYSYALKQFYAELARHLDRISPAAPAD